MRGDFSRRTFRRDRHYSRVLLQQGRVVMDADWNEQAEIQVRAMRQRMRDLVGPHAGPADALGFLIESEVSGGEIVLTVKNGLESVGEPELEPRRGRYYVEGIMVEHAYEGEAPTVETGIDPAELQRQVVLVYLEVWERHVTWLEENMPFRQRSMREVALGGPDTASRSQIRWRVGALRGPLPREGEVSEEWIATGLGTLQPRKGTLAARLTTADIGEDDPCRDTAEDRYRGPENRLYRVEIHEAQQDGENGRGPTFKWSRENGSVVYPIDLAAGQTFEGEELFVDVVGLGPDDRYRLRPGNLVELVTAERDEAGTAGPLLEVMEIDPNGRTVTLRSLSGVLGSFAAGAWALLRRWDQALEPKRENGGEAQLHAGAVVIDGSDPFVLEDGIVVQFEPPRDEQGNAEPYGFRAGDYWLIPARTIPGDIEWPHEDDAPVQETPHGVERHYAPLAVVNADGVNEQDLRRRIAQLWEAL